VIERASATQLRTVSRSSSSSREGAIDEQGEHRLGAETLEQGGAGACHVVYGIVGLKTLQTMVGWSLRQEGIRSAGYAKSAPAYTRRRASLRGSRVDHADRRYGADLTELLQTF